MRVRVSVSRHRRAFDSRWWPAALLALGAAAAPALTPAAARG